MTARPTLQDSGHKTNRETGQASGIQPSIVIKLVLFVFVIPAILLFGASGRLNWIMAWVFIGLSTVLTVVSRVLVWRVNPELIKERAESLDKTDVKPWDRVIVPLVAIFGPWILLLVAGLDKRNGWSPEVAPWLQWLALAVMVLGYALGIWAMLSNRFFSGVVRIQTDRGHIVETGGAYRYVRHPGYVGGILGDIAMPIILGSLWALAVSGVLIIAIVIRTALEDRTLQAELPGYKEYTQQTRYRLLPGVW
jgi:protein-S-isoprenylcysteine O-methyltransferase Ste14